jgi:hypothetical protein
MRSFLRQDWSSVGQLIEVELEDIFGSEFSTLQIEMEAQQIQIEIEGQLIDQHAEEFNAFCPSEYREQPLFGGFVTLPTRLDGRSH